MDKALAAVAMLDAPIEILRVGGAETTQAVDFDAAISRCPFDRLISGRKVSRSDIAAYFHTGGTTGDPKLAQHTHGGQVFQSWAACTLGMEDDDVASRSSARRASKASSPSAGRP